MSKPRYIGLENELITFENSKRVSFKHFFSHFAQEGDYFKEETAIRTQQGFGYYIDQNELEIVTPPLAMTKGYATRITNTIMTARKRVTDFGDEHNLEFTGYSMHWNFNSVKNYGQIINSIAIPFRLFGNTPLSCGVAHRSKDRGVEKVYELLSDSINNPEQINALALLLGSSVVAHEEQIFPLWPIEDVHQLPFLLDGRYSSLYAVNQRRSGRDSIGIQAQHFLELYYEWVKPYVEEFGEPNEIANLEDFIYMRKKLEFDQFKFYSHVNIGVMEHKKPEEFKGVYPSFTLDDASLSTNLTSANQPLPQECKLLGNFVKEERDNISEMEWNQITLKSLDADDVRETSLGLDEHQVTSLYHYLSLKLDCDDDFEPQWVDTSHIRLDTIINYGERENITYQPEDDVILPFAQKDRKTLIKEARRHGIKNTIEWLDRYCGRDLSKPILIGSAALILSGVLGGIIGHFREKSNVKSDLQMIEDQSQEEDKEHNE